MKKAISWLETLRNKPIFNVFTFLTANIGRTKRSAGQKSLRSANVPRQPCSQSHAPPYVATPTSCYHAPPSVAPPTLGCLAQFCGQKYTNLFSSKKYGESEFQDQMYKGALTLRLENFMIFDQSGISYIIIYENINLNFLSIFSFLMKFIYLDYDVS